MPMHKPPAPGEVLRGHYLEPMGLTVTETAARLGVSRTALSQLLTGHTHLSAEMARRLARAFGTSVELWLNLQHNRTMWYAVRQKSKFAVAPFTARPAEKALPPRNPKRRKAARG